MTTSPADDRLTISHAAALLGVSTTTVRIYIADGLLPGEKGRLALHRTQLLLRRADVKRFAQEHAARSGATRVRRAHYS